jgi:Site-specific recombinase XerD
MKELIISNIEQEMSSVLNNLQMKRLHEALQYYFGKVEITDNCINEQEPSILKDFLHSYLSAKKVEGCSERTLAYYKSTLLSAMKVLKTDVCTVSTDDLRQYLADYQRDGSCGKVTIDNIRRVLSSFFSWLEDENYILKSPVRRIKKIRTEKKVKETFPDEVIEVMRDSCNEIRDLAMIDILASTGMRVGELVRLDKKDIDFQERECIVFGKGNKERKVYFDARTKIHLQDYLTSREDNNTALFVTLQKPYNRLKISGVEIRLRNLGRELEISKVHPHKFRRTLATKAIDKGMPIEQVQHLLGHQKIDTTMEYALVDQLNVKNSHRKYIG